MNKDIFKLENMNPQFEYRFMKNVNNGKGFKALSSNELGELNIKSKSPYKIADLILCRRKKVNA